MTQLQLQQPETDSISKWESFLGVTIEVSDASSAEHVDLLRSTFEVAVERTCGLLDADAERKRKYTVHPSLPAANRTAGAIEVSDLSIFDDCGLPHVNRYRNFLRKFLTTEVSVDSAPFFGVERTTVHELWNPATLAVMGIWKDPYFEQAYYLARLNPKDKIWKSPAQRKWLDAFGPGLRIYLTELFAGRFVDRNGTKLTFDLGFGAGDLYRLDQIQVSPQVAGMIVTVLAEYLGDRAFKVPYYGASILETNRKFRAAKSAENDAKGWLADIRTAITGGKLTASDAAKLHIPQNGAMDWNSVNGSPMYANDLSRMVLGRVDELDADLLSNGRDKAALGDTLDLVDAKKSELQTAFTCFKAKVISGHLQCVFIEDSQNQGVCGRDQDTGRLEGNKTDYSDLIGKLVTFAGTTAQKNVKGLVGAVIRGVGVLALDNEVLAEVISSAASALAKKATESLVYEWLTQYIADPGVGLKEKREFLKELAHFHGLVKER